MVDRAEKEEAQGGGAGLSASSAGCSGASGSRMGPGPDSGSSAPSSVPHSLATSRDDEDDEDEESSGRRSNGHGGSRTTDLVNHFKEDQAPRFAEHSALRIFLCVGSYGRKWRRCAMRLLDRCGFFESCFLLVGD
ncbi:hypothetical protein KM043_016074 [Ampulex compressa]|nr:hypothetical protein KM043_016074 [Ampulex compressa]